MNLLYLVWHYLRARPLNTALNIVLLALGIAVITVLLLANVQLQEKISGNARGIDLVIGAKGSPMQLILSSVFHVDVPTGNIRLRDAERFARGPFVKQAIPLALGDNYRSFRIVGTNRRYADIYKAALAAGDWWKSNLEVTIGASVSASTGLKVGDTFESAHGLSAGGHAHGEREYVVAGTMQSTGSILDDLILTNVESIWEMHDQWSPAQTDSLPAAMQSALIPSVARGDSAREITALLIQYRSALAAIQLPRLVNANTSMQAASPAFETARLFSIVGAGAELLMAFAYVLVAIAALSIFIALYNSLKERRYDLAVMRTMGASPSRLFCAVLIEGSTLTLLGSLLGLLLGHLVLMAVPLWLTQTRKAGITGLYFDPLEWLLLAASLLLGGLCALVPAIQAYRTDISDVLAGNG